MKKTPLTQVKERFESKEKLVAAIQKLGTDELWLDRVNDDKGLARVSNAKLLRLHDVLESAKNQFGSREKLVTAILELNKRNKDAGYRQRLERYPLPRLLDLHRSASKASKAAEGASAKPAAQKKSASGSKSATK